MVNTNIQVLVVDDFPTMRRIIKNLLKQIGFTNIIEAEDGQHALSVMKDNSVEFVITDWNMPKMDGIELLTHLRSQADSKSLPILMVTAEAEKENILQAIQAGVNNYIVKPFTAEVLKEKIDKIFVD